MLGCELRPPFEGLHPIDTAAHCLTTPIGLRDRALIGLMVYSFARIGAALAMRVEDVFLQNRRLWVRLHEKGGRHHEMPCHHNLEGYLTGYLDGCDLREDRKGPLIRTIARGTRRLSGTPLPPGECVPDGAPAGARGTHRDGDRQPLVSGNRITTYLKNGGTLERAATMTNHVSIRTTQLYDRRHDEITLDEVEKVLI